MLLPSAIAFIAGMLIAVGVYDVPVVFVLLAAIGFAGVSLIAYRTKNILAILLFPAGILLGISAAEETTMLKSSIPQGRGIYTNLILEITSFPEVLEDETGALRYTVRSHQIKIVGETVSTLYPTQKAHIRGKIYGGKYNGRRYATIYVSDYEGVATIDNGLEVFRWLAEIRKWGTQNALKVQDKTARSVILAMIFGNQSSLDYQSVEAFRQAGVSHLLAISGLNIGIVSLFLVWLLKRFLPDRFAYMGASVGVIAYMIFGGLGAPIVRAGMMFFFFNAMKSIEIESDFLDGIAISALILLTLDPTSIYSPSFLLSYTAIAGIAVWTKPLAKRMRLHGFFGDIMASTAAATIATTPIILYFFHGVSIVTPIANLILIPAFGVYLGICIASYLCSGIGVPVLSGMLERLTEFLWNIFTGIADILSLPEYSYWTIRDFGASEVIAFYALILFAFWGIPYLQRRWLIKKIQPRQEIAE